MTATDKDRELLRRLKDDPGYYIPRLLKIKIKQPGAPIVSLFPNVAQQKLLTKVAEIRELRRPVRILVPKARQLGISTITEGLIFQNTVTHKNINSLIIAHEDDPAQELFEMTRLFYDELPLALRPMKRYSNRAELWFENPHEWERRSKPGLRSRIRVASARNVKIGRSKTLHNVHLSEWAFYNDPKTLIDGLLQAVPNMPGTMVVGESTANGVGGHWYETVMAAREGESEWIILFFPWFEAAEYRMGREDGAEFLGQGRLVLDEEEQALNNAYNLEDEQLIWRRWAIENLCGGDLAIFHQEYPSNLDESFITSGRPVFNVIKLQTMRHNCKPGERFTVEPSPDNPSGPWRVKPDPNGEVEVFIAPDEGHDYDLGADVAEGLPEGDYSAGEVCDHETGEQAAEIHGHFDDDLFARKLDGLGRWFNNALLGVERNNHGHSVLNTLVNYTKYPNLYFHDDWDDKAGTNVERPGWPTTAQTRPLMITALQEAVRDGWWKIHGSGLLGEMMTFAWNAKGKAEATGKGKPGGAKDDRVIAAGIMLEIRQRRRPGRPALLDFYKQQRETQGGAVKDGVVG
ncbi:MAG TPA: hypothetical protein VGL40_07985 [Bacillota bacterium]|jgi:hypothetical protein